MIIGDVSLSAVCQLACDDPSILIIQAQIRNAIPHRHKCYRYLPLPISVYKRIIPLLSQVELISLVAMKRIESVLTLSRVRKQDPAELCNRNAINRRWY